MSLNTSSLFNASSQDLSKKHCPIKSKPFDLGHWVFLGAAPTFHMSEFLSNKIKASESG